MRTFKIPYQTSSENAAFIRNLQRQFSSSTRYSYNRILDDIPLSQIEKDVKKLNNIELLDSWFIRCSTLKAKSILESIKELNKTLKENEQIDPKKVVFGSKYNFYQRLTGKIDKDEFKESRLMLINVQGELNQNGNRKFEFDLDNNQIIFKANKSNHLTINIPKLRKNYFNPLRFIQEHKLLFSVEIGKGNIHISFDETQITKNEYKKIENRILGIDLNPNYIGYSVADYATNQNIFDKKCYDLSDLNVDLHLKSNDPTSVFQCNKRNFEILKIAKDIVTQAVHFKVEKIIVEDLSIQSKDHKKGKRFNRMVNNVWPRNLFIRKLKMLCAVFGIKLVTINPSYSSFIGNLQHQYFDPVNSSIEIGRRGKDKYVKGSKLYPSLKVKDQWKEYLTNEVSDWQSLFKKFESENIRYRVSLLDLDPLKFLRHSYIKKKTTLYSFI